MKASRCVKNGIQNRASGSMQNQQDSESRHHAAKREVFHAMTSKRPQTPNRGAADERACWIQFVKNQPGDAISKATLEKFGRTRTKRNNARARGLGKK